MCKIETNRRDFGQLGCWSAGFAFFPAFFFYLKCDEFFASIFGGPEVIDCNFFLELKSPPAKAESVRNMVF